MMIRLENFAGLVPKLSDRSLPPNHAAIADNAQLYSGELRGLDTPLVVADLTAEIFTVKRAYRLYDGSTSLADATGIWIAFDEVNVNFIRGQLVNDSFDRYYASGGTVEPSVNTAANWGAGNIGLDLGVPEPTNSIIIEVSGGTVDETRAYVYTFVNIWGEESAPSPASNPVTGDVTATWYLTNLQTAYPIAGTHAALDKVRIYRTVTGTNSVNYRFVVELSAVSNYNDAESIDSVSLNESLETSDWNLPPVGLQGIVNMANGIMVGFVGRDIYFSEPYRPHTFPVKYVVSTDADVVGLGTYQSGVVICTSANPYVATGVHPASISLTKLDDVEPCVSFRSIVPGLDGVTYASSNGLVLVSQVGATNVTQPLITRNEWRTEFDPYNTHAAADGTKIVAFNSMSEGYQFQPLEPLGYVVKLSGFVDVQTVQMDPFTGEAYIITRDLVSLWNPTATEPLSYTWRSKVFETPMPVNMGAYRLQYEDVIGGTDFVLGFDYTNYNTSRMATPGDTLNLAPVNGVKVETGITDSPPVTQYRNPIGGGPVYPNYPLTIRDMVRVRIWADGVLRYDREITTNLVMRLPSGYKADKWQIEFQTAQNIYSFNLAGTAKELRKA